MEYSPVLTRGGLAGREDASGGALKVLGALQAELGRVEDAGPGGRVLRSAPAVGTGGWCQLN